MAVEKIHNLCEYQLQIRDDNDIEKDKREREQRILAAVADFLGDGPKRTAKVNKLRDFLVKQRFLFK